MGACSAHERDETYKQNFRWKTLKRRTMFKWENNIKRDHKKVGWRDVGWFICLRMGTSGRLL
jgi:hypothetical protein